MAANVLTDLNVMVAGQGGDGSLTVISVLTELLARRGYHLYMSRNVASRIKGGHAAAMMRGSLLQRGCMGDHIDLLVAFDQEAVDMAATRMAAESIIIFDSSDGALGRDALAKTVRVVEVPFGRFAVRDLRRDLFKNSLSFGVLSHILSIDEAEAINCLHHTFRRLPKDAVAANTRAFNSGRQYASELYPRQDRWTLAEAERSEQLLINGNDAVAVGFMLAGGRFFAGYPITPATEILEWLQKHSSRFEAVAMQAEDELAAINMALGAAMTGVRSMTATSGPGFALMQETISHAGSAEIPLVVVNCQRAGPSTGMPTKPEQSDIDMMVFGANGDFPRVVLAPGEPRDCFELSVLATNLAQQLQCPVILALDQAVSQNASTIEPFDLDAVQLQHGKQLDASELRQMSEYRRYQVTADGVSPWAVPGTPGGESLVTGNERNEWGQVSSDPENRRTMVDKRQRKLDSNLQLLPRGNSWGDADASIGLLGIGMQKGVIEEAQQRLAAAGLGIKCLQPRTIWPVIDETLDFIHSCERVYVIEHNQGGQLARLLLAAGASEACIGSIRKYDGEPFSPGDLCSEIQQAEADRLGETAS
ncbi:MAG: 2-oxoacid:acceptor oxidoreductase subunit alpha [Gammaproteobacteria bacterium]|nr:2-oxoacid:acceptor oxidoreductase subunit alpha [Gammaproteobacteria bacterium]